MKTQPVNSVPMLKLKEVAGRQGRGQKTPSVAVSYRLKPLELETVEVLRKKNGSLNVNAFAALSFRVGLAVLVQLEKEGAL